MRCLRQTLDEILGQMTRYNVLPTLINVTSKAGAPPIMPPEYVHREVVKGRLAPVGRFRSPLPTRTNVSTLHLHGVALGEFKDWQARAARALAAVPAQSCNNVQIGVRLRFDRVRYARHHPLQKAFHRSGTHACTRTLRHGAQQFCAALFVWLLCLACLVCKTGRRDNKLRIAAGCVSVWSRWKSTLFGHIHHFGRFTPVSWGVSWNTFAVTGSACMALAFLP